MLQRSHFILCVLASASVSSYMTAGYYPSFMAGLADGAKLSSVVCITKNVIDLKKDQKKLITSKILTYMPSKMTKYVPSWMSYIPGKVASFVSSKTAHYMPKNINNYIPSSLTAQVNLVIAKKAVCAVPAGVRSCKKNGLMKNVRSVFSKESFAKLVDTASYSAGYLSSLTMGIWLEFTVKERMSQVGRILDNNEKLSKDPMAAFNNMKTGDKNKDNDRLNNLLDELDFKVD